MSPSRQRAIGLAIAGTIITAWLALHVWGVFFHAWFPGDGWRAPLLVIVQTWLSIGLFIVAHDAIHGSLAPGRPGVNRAVGRLCVGIYAGFAFDRLAASHHRHHVAPGTPMDPDFHAPRPDAFAPWFYAFFRTHFGWAEFARVAAVLAIYLLLGAGAANLLVFWALPAALSAVALFTFGTFLPHRVEAAPFADIHRARSLNHGWLVSLLTCFHFGSRHHEHHLAPHLPWWRLTSHPRFSAGPPGRLDMGPEVRSFRAGQ